MPRHLSSPETRSFVQQTIQDQDKKTHTSGPWFNIKMSSYQYRKSHCGDKTILRPSYLHNGISYTGKMISLYWIGAQSSILLMLCEGYPWVTAGFRWHWTSNAESVSYRDALMVIFDERLWLGHLIKLISSSYQQNKVTKLPTLTSMAV